MTDWQYYDFASNWQQFYSIWQRQNIQNCVHDCMEDFEREYTDDVRWSTGQPIWTASLTDEGRDYINNIIDRKADEFIHHHRIYKKFIAAHDRAGYRLSKYDDEQVIKYFSKIGAFDEIRNQFLPHPNELEYWICDGAEDFFVYPLAHVMKEMYPDETLLIVEGNQYPAQKFLAMPSKKWIIDIIRNVLPDNDIARMFKMIDDDVKTHLENVD